MLMAVLAGGVCLQATTGWQQPNYSATIATHFTGRGQSQTGSSVMVLNHDGAATIRVSAVSSGSEVLKSVSSDTLTTSYMLTGSALGASADGDWVASSTFADPGRSYSVQGTGPSDITLSVRGASRSDRAVDAGTYNASLVVTVSW
jgi:hypothetical protein